MILSENSPLRKNSFHDNCMLNMDQYIAVGLTSILQQMILIDDEQQDYELRKEVVIPECIKTLFYSVILERRVEKRRFIICTSVPFNTLFGFSSFHYIVQETIFFLRGFEPKTWRTQVHASQNLIPPFQDRMQETRNLYI